MIGRLIQQLHPSLRVLLGMMALTVRSTVSLSMMITSICVLSVLHLMHYLVVVVIVNAL